MKRIFDILVSGLFLIILSPLIIVISIIIKLTSKGSVFFKQRRIGRLNKEFYIYKFRTMRTDTPNVATHLLKDPEKYITPIGKFLRKTSLDELPQLFNVLKGDMSLVGPRPLLVEYLPLYSEEQMKRHHVRPGITGYAQVNGRNNISWTKKFELDVYYVENFSLWLDIKILFQTVAKVLGQADINQEGNATVERFNGMN